LKGIFFFAFLWSFKKKGTERARVNIIMQIFIIDLVAPWRSTS